MLIPVLHVAALDVVGRRILRGSALRSRVHAGAGLLLSVLAAPLVVGLGVARAGVLAGRRHPLGARFLETPPWAWVGRALLAVLFAAAVVDLLAKVNELR